MNKVDSNRVPEQRVSPKGSDGMPSVRRRLQTRMSVAIRVALFLFGLAVCPAWVSAQDVVSGKVSSNGEPLTGATVREKGTTHAAVTDIEGMYSLSVPADAILEVSYLGYKAQSVKVGGRKQVNFELEEDVNMLEEVVAVGYGVQTQLLRQNFHHGFPLCSMYFHYTPRRTKKQALDKLFAKVYHARQRTGEPDTRLRGNCISTL